MQETLRTDFHRIPQLLALGAPEQPQPVEELPEIEELMPAPDPDEAAPLLVEAEPAAQLGLF